MYPPFLEKIITELDPDADDFICERYAKRMQKVLDVWSVSVCKSPSDVDNLRLYLTEGISGDSPVPSQIIPLRAKGPL
jgi:hypothetical protein